MPRYKLLTSEPFAEGAIHARNLYQSFVQSASAPLYNAAATVLPVTQQRTDYCSECIAVRVLQILNKQIEFAAIVANSLHFALNPNKTFTIACACHLEQTDRFTTQGQIAVTRYSWMPAVPAAAQCPAQAQQNFPAVLQSLLSLLSLNQLGLLHALCQYY